MRTLPLTTIAEAAAVSADGTSIGYRRMGAGPALVLIQGAMGTSEHFIELGSLLSDSLTVVLPDRRGRA
jgi:pimeloyl-ACP methyl ester carboxylesterase